MDKLQAVNTFICVAEAGSFVGAMETARLSKPAVSRQIAELEEHLGTRLLQRTTRRVSLTSEGERYFQRCKEILGMVQEADAEINERTGQAHGRLKIGAPQSFGVLHLAPLWGRFAAENPHVSLDITLSDRVVDLIDEGYDLAIRIARMPASSLISRSLTATRMIVCASPDYLSRREVPQSPADLSRHDVISYSYLASGTEWHFTGPDGVTTSTRINTRIFANNGDTCRAAALAHQGIIMQPDFMVFDDIRQGRLTRLLPDYSTTELTVYAVYPTRKLLPVKVRRLIDFLVEAFRTPPWMDPATAASSSGTRVGE
jgi:DNA-binding transcriptional LysR family regulator